MIITAVTLVTAPIGAILEPPKAEDFVTSASQGLYYIDVSVRPCTGHVAQQWRGIQVWTPAECRSPGYLEPGRTGW